MKRGAPENQRPTSRPWWKLWGEKADAIDQRTEAVRVLEAKIYEQREKFRENRPESYG